MSIERTPSGYRVRWREGKHNKAKLIGPRKADAIAFEQELKRAKRMGTLAHMEMGNESFGDFAREWWQKHASRKAPKTQTLYAYLLDKHLDPYFGGLRLAQITVAEIEGWLSVLEAQGTGRVAQQKALALLSGILGKAVKWGRLATNPATYAERPKVERKPIKPPTPLEVEHVRVRLLQHGRLGDSVLVSVLAYAGLRPQEALALRWTELGDRAIAVHSPKTNANRSVPLLSPLAKDLAEWKLLTGGAFDLVFPNRKGERWSESGWSNWRRRVWHELADFTPYALRHLYVSLLIREGRSISEIAAQAGHSPVVCMRTYAHLLPELSGRGSAEDAIRAARAEVREQQRVTEG